MNTIDILLLSIIFLLGLNCFDIYLLKKSTHHNKCIIKALLSRLPQEEIVRVINDAAIFSLGRKKINVSKK